MKITRVQVRTATFATELVSDMRSLLKEEGVGTVEDLCRKLKMKYKAPINYTFINSHGDKVQSSRINAKDEKELLEDCKSIKFGVYFQRHDLEVGPYTIKFPFDISKFHRALTALEKEAFEAEQYETTGR